MVGGGDDRKRQQAARTPNASAPGLSGVGIRGRGAEAGAGSLMVESGMFGLARTLALPGGGRGGLCGRGGRGGEL